MSIETEAAKEERDGYGDGWHCDWCDKEMPDSQKGYVHIDGLAYCSWGCAEERDASI